MPVIATDVRDGDPTVQASQQHRGTVKCTFDDGRILEMNLRAPDLDGWNDAVAGAALKAEDQMMRRDADEAVGDQPIDSGGNKEADQYQVCAAYMRDADAESEAYNAWVLYSRIDDYVQSNGGWVTFKPVMLAEGMDEEFFDRSASQYQYLSAAGRPATMSGARTIQDGWENRG